MAINTLIEQAQVERQQRQDKDGRRRELETIVGSSDAIQKALIESIKRLILFTSEHTTKTEVQNFPDSVKTPDIATVVEAVRELNRTQGSASGPVIIALKEIADIMDRLPKELPNIPEPKGEVTIKNLPDPGRETKQIVSAIQKLRLDPKFDPKIEVKPSDVVVQPTDFKPIVTLLVGLEKAVKSIHIPETVVDFTPIVAGLFQLDERIQTLINKPIPVPETPLPFKNSDNQGVQANVDADFNLISVSGLGIPPYDYVSLAQNSTQDIYTFKEGGASGTTVATITITYTDSGKGTISTVAKT